MKANAITRIIIFSIVIFILLGILLVGLGVGMFVFIFDGENYQYNTTENEVTLSAGDINSIDIEWAAGNIQIVTAPTDVIQFYESGTSSESDKMVWDLSGGNLTIRYSQPRVSLGFFSYSSKDLVINVPESWICKELSLSVGSSDMRISGLVAKKVEIDSASGECDFLDCKIEALDIDTASGSVSYAGTLNSLECDAASASFEGVFENTPNRIEMDSASGDMELTFPEGSGFRLTMDALSGKFHSDLPVKYDGNHYTYGDEHCIINFDGASGSITINAP